MYDLPHLLYIGITIAFMLIFSFLFRNVKENNRLLILKIIAVLTFLTHISLSVYNLFTVPGSTLGNLGWDIYPYYFCNLTMILLPVMFLGPKSFKKFYPFVLWAGLFGGVLTMIFPMFYHGGNILEFGTLKSFASHSFMIFAFIYAVMSGEYKIKISDSLNMTIGLLLSGAWGFFTNWLWDVTGRGVGNSMYLNAPALDGTPLTGYVIAPIMVAIVFLTAVIITGIKKLKTKNKT